MHKGTMECFNSVLIGSHSWGGGWIIPLHLRFRVLCEKALGCDLFRCAFLEGKGLIIKQTKSKPWLLGFRVAEKCPKWKKSLPFSSLGEHLISWPTQGPAGWSPAEASSGWWGSELATAFSMQHLGKYCSIAGTKEPDGAARLFITGALLWTGLPSPSHLVWSRPFQDMISSTDCKFLGTFMKGKCYKVQRFASGAT